MAYQWPMLNDETYYWDWSRNLHLSYIDAPPSVAWVAYVGSKLLTGKLGARLAVPFLYLGTSLFLINSYKVLSKKKHTETFSFLTQKENIVIFIFTAIPLFNMHGILLMPDAPLFFASAGALYFALKSYQSQSITSKGSLDLWSGMWLGLFLGLAVASKYQAAPIAIAFFIAICTLRGIQTTLQKDIKFWIITIFSACVIASPLLIWNLQNEFASFKFQGQHGFSTWSLNLPHFFLYLLSALAALLPWYSYLFIKQLYHSFRTLTLFKSIDFIPVAAFLSIFIFIGSSALGGGQTQVHWITPSALFLIPLVVVYWENLITSQKVWNKINIGSILICFGAGFLIFTNPIQTILSSKDKILGYKIEKIHNGLYRNFNWANLAYPLKDFATHIPNFNAIEKPYFSSLETIQCTKEPYLFSLSWRWTSQFAFFLPSQPRVFNLSPAHASYYAWRDNLEYLAGCNAYILGERHMYNYTSIRKYMNIDQIKYFTATKSYTNEPMEMVFIKGKMRDQKTLKALTSELIKNPQY